MTQMLDAAQIREATPWPELIGAIGDILESDGPVAPERHVHPVDLAEGGIGSLLLMPAWCEREIIGVKAVTYFPSNSGTSSSTTHSAYVCFDRQTGEPRAVLDGDELTVRRTAAVSALAARSLARPDAARLLIVGTGRLAPNMVRAHTQIRRYDAVQIWGRNPAAAEEVAEVLAGEGLPAEGVANLGEAIGWADVVSCATSAASPVILGEQLAPGTHVDLVGGFRADMREADDAAIARAVLFVDTVAGAVQAGDLAQPLADGVIAEGSIMADLRSVVAGRHPGRRTSEEITLFKSAGFALADLAAARLALRRADHPSP